MNPEERYLFDTDAITNIFKKKPSLKLVENLKTLPKEAQYVATITISEIVYGAMKSNRPEFHLQNMKQIIIPSVNILPFDSSAAFIAGEIRASLEKKGTPLAFADLLIASIALANNLVLVTGNTKHFSRIDNLKCENWLI